jgi:8-amino-7-oxononanoate synthase
VLERARYLEDGLRALGYRTLSGEPVRTSPAADAPARTLTTPIVPILVGDDWKAALLWRALYEGGVFTNCALHPAVPPGGALLRTSVMATHDRATLDRALEVFARVKPQFEAEHGPLPGPRED